MTEKRLGPEGARFKKGSWAPTNEGSGSAKRTYLDEREALEARNAELEAKVAELEAALADPRLGSQYIDFTLPSSFVDEHKGPFYFDGEIEPGEPLEHEAIRIAVAADDLMVAWNRIHEETERCQGLKSGDAVDMAKVVSAKISDITDDINLDTKYGSKRYNLKCGDEYITLVCADNDAEFLVNCGEHVDLRTIIYRYKVTRENFDLMRTSLYRLQDNLVSLFYDFSERSKKVVEMYGRIHTLKQDRRNLAWVAIVGWVSAALIWYF